MSLRNLVYRLLRKSEAVTGTDNVYLAKGGFWLTLGQLLASSSSLILAILFGHYVSKAAYGTYQYLLSWGSVLTIASLTGMSDALTQAVARGMDATLYRAIRLRLRASVFGFVAAAVAAGWYLWHGNPTLGIGFLIIGALFPLNASLTAYNDYLTGKREFELQTRFYMAGSLVTGALLALMILVAPSPLAFISVFCIAWCAVNAVALAYTMRKRPPAGGDDPHVADFALKLTALDLFGNIATYFDRIVIFTLLGAEPTAAYAFAIAPPEQIKGYLKNLYFLALPKVASRPLHEIRKGFFKKFWLMTGLVAVGIAAYALLAPFVYHWLFPKYPEAVLLTQIYAIGLLGASTNLVAAVFNGHKRTKENTQYQVASSAIGIIMLIVFVPKLGLMGAVLARVATRLIGMLIGVLLVGKIFKEAKEAS